MERLNSETLKPWGSCPPCFKVTRWLISGEVSRNNESPLQGNQVRLCWDSKILVICTTSSITFGSAVLGNMNIEAFDNSDSCLPRIHWFWINHFEVATNCAMFLSITDGFLPHGRVCNMLAWKSSYYPKAGETAIAGFWMNNRAPKATESHQKGISDPICSFHKIRCNHSKCRWDSIRGKIKNWYCKYLLEGFEGFLWKLKHILIPPPTLGKTTLQLEWNTLHTRFSKLSKGTNMTNQKSYEAIMFQKTSNFHVKNPSKNWPNFQCEFIVTKHPSREARQGLVILRKMSPGGELSHVFVVGTNSENLGPNVQIRGKSIFQSLICSILMIAIGELVLKFSSWWHEPTCWFGCFKLSWCCFSRHVYVEQDMFQAHTS